MTFKHNVLRLTVSVLYPFMHKIFKVNVLNDDDTVNKIISSKMSVCRFGDGELDIMHGKSEGFQSPNKALAERLLYIINQKDDHLMVCLPIALNNVGDDLTEDASTFWKKTIFKNLFFYKKTLDPDRVYGNTNFTRFYIDYKDKNKDKAIAKLRKIQAIWNGMDVVLVEGENTKCGVGNDIFCNVRSIKRIICPGINAFEKYNEIFNTVRAGVKNEPNTLLLFCLGATATCLAFDFFKLGYRAIDLGHLDLEYEWALAGATKKQIVEGKAVNECYANIPANPLNDDSYQNQIIAKIN